MERPDFDLQSHSTHSDGVCAPAEVVARAAAAGVRLLALTDHDTVAGVDEALAAGREHGVTVVPAIELSCIDEAGPDLHLLGYALDHHDARLAEDLARWREDRTARIGRMTDAMRELGWAIDDTVLAGRQSPGRPHLARAVLEHQDNAERLQAEGLTTYSEVLEAYLIPGTPGFRGRTTPTVAEAIATVHGAGGVAVWAHPFFDVHGAEAVTATVERFCVHGLDGVEAFYPTHTQDQADHLVALAQRHGLLTTGSTDFHAPDRGVFGRFLGFSLHGHVPHLDRLLPST